MVTAFVRYGFVLLFSLPLLAAEPPSVILSRTDGGTARPIFIAASAMITADGTPSAIVPEDWRVRQQRLSATVARLRSQHRAEVSALSVPTSAVTCRDGMMLETQLEPLVDRHNVHDSIANARAIVTGTIKSVTPGFFYGDPASLIELSDLDKLKLDASYSSVRDSIYLRLPYAQFVTGGTEYCRESAPGSYVPHAGDRLLVFAYDKPLDADGTLVYSTSGDVIAQSIGETVVRIPKSLAFFDRPNASISSIVATIHTTLSGNRRAPEGRDRRAQ